MSITMQCPGCKAKLMVKDDVNGKRIKCPTCAIVFVASDSKPIAAVPIAQFAAPLPATQDARLPQGEPKKVDSWLLTIVGTILFLGGVAFSYAFANMDTTVEVGDGMFKMTRVHNIGLMDQRRNGLMMSLAACGAGFAMVVVGQKK